MECNRAVELITGSPVANRHGDHISFNTAEFMAWSQQAGDALSPQAAEHLLAEFCQPVGHGESGTMWRFFLP